MIITYQGEDSFKISQGDLTIAINPRSKISADITIFSTGRDEISQKSGFVIDGPGEYEVKGVFIKGFLSEGKDRLNTLYIMNYESMKLCYLGNIYNPVLDNKVLEAIEDIDILFVPSGSTNVLDPASAYKLAVSLEPAIIIPMKYTKETLDQFNKEGGAKPEVLDKLVIKKKDLEGKEGEIIVLSRE